MRRTTVLFIIFSAVFAAAFFAYSLLREDRGNGAPAADEPHAQTGSPAVNFAGRLESLPDRKEQSLSLLFFGDLMLDRHVKEMMGSKGPGYLLEKIASGTDNIISGNDLVCANLEGAVTDNGIHYKPDNLYDFAFEPADIAELAEIGFDFFILANNHFADQGERGIIETRKNLDGAGLKYAGCQDRAVGNCSIGSFEAKGKSIGMAAFSMVYGLLYDEKEAVSMIGGLKEDNDLVVANVHWGAEYEHIQNRFQIDLAHKLADAGADLVIGHHPHVIQGMEVYITADKRRVPVFYSLGNFVFDQYFSADTQESLAIKVEISTDGRRSAHLEGIISEKSRLRLMDGGEKKELMKKFISWSKLDKEQEEQLSRAYSVSF